ncbi:MAG: hypothetical protein GJ671_08785 [Alteromonadaceae bacterium]|nr:hypothetical protein [Alteromonadaceae bacterium]
MKTYSKTLLALAAVGAFSANASIINVNFPGTPTESITFEELVLISDYGAFGDFTATSYFVDSDDDGTIEAGELVVDAGIQRVFFGYDDPTSGNQLFDLSGNYLELNYFVYGNSTQVSPTQVVSGFSGGLFNIFTVDGMGTSGDQSDDVRTELAASFLLNNFVVSPPSLTGIPQFEFGGVAIEAGDDVLTDQWGVGFDDLINGGNAPTFAAQIDFDSESDAFVDPTTDLTFANTDADAFLRSVLNSSSSVDGTCTFGGCNPFIAATNNPNNPVGSDDFWDLFKADILQGTPSLVGHDVFSRTVTLASDDVVINANAPGTMGVLGAGLLALAGLRRRKS